MSATREKELFHPYQWAPTEVLDSKTVIPGHKFADLAGKMNDIGMGLSAILQMIEVNGIEKGNGGTPLLSEYHEGCLMRLAIRAADMLVEDSQESMDHAFKQHTPRGREEQREQRPKRHAPA